MGGRKGGEGGEGGELLPSQCLGASSVYTIQPCTSLPCHLIHSYIGRVQVCLAVTCHLRFWQNYRDLLCATTVTRGCTLKADPRKKRKKIPPLLRGLEPGTFRSRNPTLYPLSYPRSPLHKVQKIEWFLLLNVHGGEKAF